MNSTQKRDNWGYRPLSSSERAEVKLAAQACRFFSCEEAMAWAMSAYREATRDLQPPKGEPWVVEGCGWSGPVEFAQSFEHHFQRRFWDACERSPAYRLQRRKQEAIYADPPVSCAPQEPELPQRGSMGTSATADRGSPC